MTVRDIELGRAPRPKVLDMFAGGGSIPFEALRLGCEAYAIDLNPVAYIVELCTLFYPQKYGKPDACAIGSAPDGAWAGLAREVEHWGRWVEKKVKAEIGDLYPPIPDPDASPETIGGEPQQTFAFAKPSQRRLELPGGHLTAVAYLWTRTVRCKNRECGAVVPLVRQTWLCIKPGNEKLSRPGRYVALELVIAKEAGQRSPKRVRFRVVEAETEDEIGFDPEGFSKGGNAICPFCGTVADNKYIKTEGMEGRIGQQMMAVVCCRRGEDKKLYFSADELPQMVLSDDIIHKRIDSLCSCCGITRPSEPMPPQGSLGFRVQAYGIRDWGQLFNERQMLCLLAIAAVLREAEAEMAAYDLDRRRGVLLNIAAMHDRLASTSSTGCHWHYTKGERTANTFAQCPTDDVGLF